MVEQILDVKLPETCPDILTLRQALIYHLDIFGRPRRYFFGNKICTLLDQPLIWVYCNNIELLSFFSTDPLHTDKLKEFASTSLEAQTELNAYCTRPRRTFYEVLADFSSVKCPPQYIFDLIPPIRHRSYSISSSPKVRKNIPKNES